MKSGKWKILNFELLVLNLYSNNQYTNNKYTNIPITMLLAFSFKLLAFIN